jgi:hypothetical protein
MKGLLVGSDVGLPARRLKVIVATVSSNTITCDEHSVRNVFSFHAWYIFNNGLVVELFHLAWVRQRS